MIDFICCEGAHVEMWVPKGSLQGFVFDARVLVIAGRPAHRILRLSRTPLTNLHLGNRRASFDLLRPEIQEAVLSAATRAAGCFPNSLVCGVDVLWNRGSFGARVVEVNAFGDLLPGLLFEGMGAYDAIVRQLLKGGAAYAEHA